jgi:carbon monoxide dehydrogenase subunit G
MLLWQPAGAAPSVTPQELQQLRKGTVLVEEMQPPANSSFPKSVQARILIDRPIEQVWQIVSNQNELFAGDPKMKRVQVMSRPSSSREIVSYSLAVSPLLPAFNYTNQVDYTQPTLAKFRRLSGSFKDFAGFCHLAPVDGGKRTLLTYSLAIDFGLPLPGGVARNFVRADLPRTLRGIEERVYKKFPS